MVVSEGLYAEGYWPCIQLRLLQCPNKLRKGVCSLAFS